MTKFTKKEEEILEETSKESEKIPEKPKTIPPVSQPRTPTFLNANSFGKWKPLNNFNNRQRPWRAASRGR